MKKQDKAIIKFDDDGNLNLYGNDDVLSRVFLSSDKLESFRTALSDFQNFARCCPEMVEVINELLPKMPDYVADLSLATRKLMQEGKLVLRPDKEGHLLATLINPDNQRFDRQVRLKEVQQLPAVNDMMFSLSFMAVTQQLNEIQEGIAQLRQAQIHDRETDGMVAAQNLKWAALESDPEKRAMLCREAHRDAVYGFHSCLSTVEESAGFFLSQPSSESLVEAIIEQVKPWNWGKTIRAATQAMPQASELRRSVAKCTYCAQYASAASFMLNDRAQVVRDLDMYAEHMSRTILGEKAGHLKPWLSPKTLEGLPLPRRALSDRSTNVTDVISFVESAVSRIEELDATSDKFIKESSDDASKTKNLPKE
ncbi:MAG: hypothetical protein ACOYIK_08085 [Coriobacteriales bacterium]|jgi:hypothetical protein